MKVYLIGPINGCSDAEAKNWREFLTRELTELGHEVLDPMRRDYRGRELEPGIADEIVLGDEEDCAACDVAIRFAPKPSEGSAQENYLVYRVLNKPVITIVPAGAPRSPWLVRHCTVLVATEREAIDALPIARHVISQVVALGLYPNERYASMQGAAT
jgi:hypothetical protein